MSVLVSDRTESKFEAITYSIELHDMLIDFMQHGFGVKSVDDYVRLRYAYGKDDRENFSKYRFMMQNFKNRVDQLAALITNNVRAANTIYPTNLHECEMISVTRRWNHISDVRVMSNYASFLRLISLM